MKKKLIAMALIFVMIFAFTACGGGGGEASDSPASETAEAGRMGNSIDLLSTDKGALKYIGLEKANEGLVEEENAYVFAFEFTNYQDDAADVQSAFEIQFFQNNSEINEADSYNSKGGDQYDLAGEYYNQALKDGTVTFGKIVIVKDDSPVIIMTKDKDNDDNKSMVEVNLSDGTATGGSEDKDSDSSSADVESMLQGDWILQETNTFHFENGTISLSGEGVDGLSGEYTVNSDESVIDCVLHDSSQNLKIHLPYKVEDGKLRLFNNHDEEMVHQ